MSVIKFIALFLFASLAYGADFTNRPEYKEIENFLATIETIQGKGYEDDKGKRIPFDFILSLPAKLRLNYNSPGMHISIIVNKGIFTYYDMDRDQKTQLPINKTFVSIFNKSRLSLEDVKIISLQSKGNKYILEIEKKLASEEGRFRIFFNKSENLLSLNRIEILNGSELHKVFFTYIEINKKISGSPFLIPNKKVF